MRKTIQLLARLSGCFLAMYGTGALAQQQWTDMDHDMHQLYDRMVIRAGGDTAIHTALKPYLRHDLVRLAEPFAAPPSWERTASFLAQSILDQNNEFLTPVYNSGGNGESGLYYTDSTRTFYTSSPDVAWQPYRTSRRPLWKTFYRTPAHFYEVDVKDFYLRVNPLLHIGAGRESAEGSATFINQRGINVRGGVGKNVFFQTSLFDSQARFPNYINEYTAVFDVVPGAGLYKDFRSSFFDFTHGRDYLLAYGYVGANLGKYIGFQLGHSQGFIGDGIRSLLLSDFSTPYFSLKINTRIWKLHYQNIFAELAADNFRSVLGLDTLIPKKYMAAHYLSFKPARYISIGLFESVVFDRGGRGFELQYLNPVILYRSIEGTIGSPDNAMLGLNARVDIRKTLSVYGQFVLDDIFIGEILDGHMDWWGNKFGYQLGIRYIDMLGIPFLDGTVERNHVRPYTYSHYEKEESYTHYRQPLAHPMGANFNEWILSLRYRPAPRWLLSSSLYVIKTGEDQDSISFGGNIYVPNTQRPGDYGHFTGSGIETEILYWNTCVQFELTSGVYIDGRFMLRNKTSELPERDLRTRLIQLGVRYNMARREDVF